MTFGAIKIDIYDMDDLVRILMKNGYSVTISPIESEGEKIFVTIKEREEI